MIMMTQRINLIIISVIGIVGLFTFVFASSILSAYQQIPTVGVVKSVGVGVYKDYECIENVTFIDWGILGPGERTDFVVYVRNEGNTKLKLNIMTSHWNPEIASKYITLEWTPRDCTINPSEVVPITLTLSVSPNIESVTNFQFEISIVGTEA